MVRSWGRAAVVCCAVVLTALVVLEAQPSDAAVRRKVKVTAAPAPAFAPATVEAVRAEADWALQAQLADGALGHYVDRVKVWPYLANFTAIGLARATEVTGDARYVAAAWRWLAWYQASQDGQGFVTDYTVVGGVPVSTGDMDSTDAYAGTFLLAVRRAYRATGDKATLRSLQAGITNAVRAIEATQDTDGLTWAKPTWKVKYLMDQAETLAGLRAAAELAATLGDGALAQRVSADATRMQTGIDGLWNTATGAYDWAVHETGVRTPTNWTVLYPEALQQAWAVAFGAVPKDRAKTLMARFGAEQPRWDQPPDYWPVAGWAYLRIGDTARAGAAATAIQNKAAATARAWPYTPANAGQLIGLLSADDRVL